MITDEHIAFYQKCMKIAIRMASVVKEEDTVAGCGLAAQTLSSLYAVVNGMSLEDFIKSSKISYEKAVIDHKEDMGFEGVEDK